jgi:hypothetical protein
MAKRAYTYTMPTPFALTAGAKTTLMAIAPAGHGLVVVEMSVSFNGVTSSAVPALVELVRSTQAGAGTSGVAPTITQVRGRTTGATAPTGGSNYTVEPTALVNMRRWYVPQFMGLLLVQFPLGREPESDASGGTTKAIGVRINVSADVTGLVNMEVEAE